MLRALSLRLAAACALLAIGLVANDRGLIDSDDILSIGRQWVETHTPARASQATICIPTTGTLSGLVAMQDANAALAALLSSNSGASAPANDCSAVAVKGQVWYDTANKLLKQFDGTAWDVLGYFDDSNNIWTPPVGGGQPATLASAGTTDLGSVPQSFVTVTGATTITGFGSSAVTGTIHWVKFSGSLILTYNASSMILPGGVDMRVAAGDQLALIALGAGNWQALTPLTKAVGAQPVTCVLTTAGANCTSGTPAIGGVFTTPAGATRIEIVEMGPGGGGGGSGTTSSGGSGAAGSAVTSFNSITAGVGGAGIANNGTSPGGGGAPTNGSGSATLRITGTNGQTGYDISNLGSQGGTPGCGLSSSGSGGILPGGYGAGGPGGITGNAASFAGAGAGASGECVQFTINNPTGTYPYAVGTGGNGGSAGSGGQAGGAANSGVIVAKIYFN